MSMRFIRHQSRTWSWRTGRIIPMSISYWEIYAPRTLCLRRTFQYNDVTLSLYDALGTTENVNMVLTRPWIKVSTARNDDFAPMMHRGVREQTSVSHVCWGTSGRTNDTTIPERSTRRVFRWILSGGQQRSLPSCAGLARCID